MCSFIGLTGASPSSKAKPDRSCDGLPQAIAEIERLKQSEFPYGHIREALFQLEKVFHDQLAQLNKLTPKSTPMIAENACSQSLTYLFNYTPFLGFILRATNECTRSPG